ncbi:Secretion-regulating guanine nucleotide exchange factor [Anas platyrhynchos]|uniref:Secretion-regulating guanine nucleotide exchange factor n=1 Tax=Anas platyrhynchos TaxID=8839 RepID=R0LUI2_ANAPL|nr:Secretion-regulating guanine nucleotide exchange factor [Anas platyrhynchos]
MENKAFFDLKFALDEVNHTVQVPLEHETSVLKNQIRFPDSHTEGKARQEWCEEETDGLWSRSEGRRQCCKEKCGEAVLQQVCSPPRWPWVTREDTHMEGARISLLGSELQIIVFYRKEHLQKQIPEQNTRFCSVETALQGKRIAVRQEEIVEMVTGLLSLSLRQDRDCLVVVTQSESTDTFRACHLERQGWHQAREAPVMLASCICCEELLEGHGQSSSFRYQEENQTQDQKAADIHWAKSPGSMGKGKETPSSLQYVAALLYQKYFLQFDQVMDCGCHCRYPEKSPALLQVPVMPVQKPDSASFPPVLFSLTEIKHLPFLCPNLAQNVLQAGDTCFSWGWNEHGMCGDGTEANVQVPKPVKALGFAKQILIGSCLWPCPAPFLSPSPLTTAVVPLATPCTASTTAEHNTCLLGLGLCLLLVVLLPKAEATRVWALHGSLRNAPANPTAPPCLLLAEQSHSGISLILCWREQKMLLRSLLSEMALMETVSHSGRPGRGLFAVRNGTRGDSFTRREAQQKTGTLAQPGACHQGQQAKQHCNRQWLHTEHQHKVPWLGVEFPKGETWMFVSSRKLSCCTCSCSSEAGRSEAVGIIVNGSGSGLGAAAPPEALQLSALPLSCNGELWGQMDLNLQSISSRTVDGKHCSASEGFIEVT